MSDAKRYTDEEFEKMANAKPQHPPAQRGSDTAQQRRMREFQRRQGQRIVGQQIKRTCEEEGAVAILSMSPRGHDGTLFVQGGGAYTTSSPDNFLDIMITVEDYMSICRLVKAGIPVKLEADVKTAI